MPVDRRVVEVGPEDPLGLGLAVGHEGLSAESDDRLAGVAVAVVLEALPVEADHLGGVLDVPEDVVVEEPVAVEGGLLGDLGGADRAVPDEGGDAVQWPRGRGEALQRSAELPLPGDVLLAPQPAEQVVVLDRQRDALADVLAEPRVDRAGVAAAHHQVDAPARQVLEEGVVLGDAHRVGRRDEGRRGRELESLGLGGDVGEVGRRRGGDEGRVVVLARGEDVEPDLLGLERDLGHRVDPLALARRATRRGVHRHVADGEDSELHGRASCWIIESSTILTWRGRDPFP